MSEFKKFTREGNLLVMKRQYGFGLIVVIGMAALTAAGMWNQNSAMIWIFGILTVLCFISIWQENFSIDLHKKAFIIKNGLINKSVEIPFTDFVNFEMVKVRHNFITTNVSLNLYYLKDDKEKCTGIAQSFSTRSLQVLMNEINEILSQDDYSRKI
ncbi:hypothetical protein [Flavobacterium hungaricum]|uniref:DUF304 domain-containing protein n=1 Tax=Flavobacterium hungaricum TaxID=2082725 RepID=A0ABR9TSI4_9FLAO|nr:hypothetical protein [Flavobacterium hungaricum]MBE8728315.1 hypothetical protein [Flavobacterium hungaricum]